LKIYSLFHKIKAKAFSLAISGSFAEFGRATTVYPPLRIVGPNRIKIGSGVFIGPNSWLNALESSDHCVISIGDRVSVVGSFVISAAKEVIIEDDVLIARNVYISDHSHRYHDTFMPIQSQGIDKIAPVIVKQGSWLGQNCVIGPGVSVGVGSVVGANSFVNRDIPDYSVAAGSPAKMIKTFGPART